MKSLKSCYTNLLKESINFNEKKATVYHLTGNWLQRNWSDSSRAYNNIFDPDRPDANLEYADEMSDIISRTKNRKQKVELTLAAAKTRKLKKHIDKLKTPAGKAYYIYSLLKHDPYSSGSLFTSGGGDMYGKGLYTCYELNPRIAITYGKVITRFEVDISNFMIFNEETARKVHKENWRLEDQFMMILNNKGLSLESENEDFRKSMNNFIEYLKERSLSTPFIGSKHAGTRTAPVCLEVLKNYSRFFGAGQISKLRDIIDGVIFFGKSDGPVCLIYRPEISGNYYFSGIGYFDKNGEAIISSKPGELVGKPSEDLMDTYQASLSLENERQKEDLEFTKNKFESAKNILLDESPLAKTNKLFELIFDPTINQNNKKYREILINRINNTDNIDEEFKFFSDFCLFQTTAPSRLAKPFIDFVELIGPGMDIINEEEFIEYCKLFKDCYKSYQLNSSRDSTISILDTNILDASHLKLREDIDSSFNNSILEMFQSYKKTKDDPNLIKDVLKISDLYAMYDASFSFGYLPEVTNLEIDFRREAFDFIKLTTKDLFKELVESIKRIDKEDFNSLSEYSPIKKIVDEDFKISYEYLNQLISGFSNCIVWVCEMQYNAIGSVYDIKESLDIVTGISLNKLITEVYEFNRGFRYDDWHIDEAIFFKNFDKNNQIIQDKFSFNRIKDEIINSRAENLCNVWGALMQNDLQGMIQI